MSNRAGEISELFGPSDSIPAGDGEFGGENESENENATAANSAQPSQATLSSLPPNPGEEKELSAQDLTRELLERTRAQKSLIDFCCFVDDKYEPYDIHRYVARKLEKVEAGLLRRLAIFVPPAVGKSRIASELFPAWFLGRNPDKEFIETSYDAKLAFGFGRNVRNLVRSPRYRLIFPEVDIAPDAASMDEWKTNQEGEYKAEGVGGGLIGFHAHVAIIDDPFKNYATASSINERIRVWDWYTGVLLNRLRSYHDGPGAVILIMQRWHDDDLGGRIEKLTEEGEEEWDVVSIPSIAEADDPLGREVGEALLPDGPNRRPIEELKALRARNPSLFMALHQQKPVSDQGDLFNPQWFKHYRPNELPAELSIYGGSDFALSKGVGDYTVHAIVGVDPNGHLWLIDLWRKQCDILEGIEKAIDFMAQYKPRKWFLEKVMMTKALGPVLQKRKSDRNVWTILQDVSVTGKGRKDSPERAGSFAGAMQMGYVHIPESASWVGDLEYELSRFPNGRFDDQVDVLALFGMNLRILRGGVSPSEPDNDPYNPKPAFFTFDDWRNQSTALRQGKRVQKRAMVLPVPEATVLDEEFV